MACFAVLVQVCVLSVPLFISQCKGMWCLLNGLNIIQMLFKL